MNEELKKFLKDLKRQLMSLNHYANSVKPLPSDRASANNLIGLRKTIDDIGYKLDRNLVEFEKNLREAENRKIDEQYQKRLAKTNSPDKRMIANSKAYTNFRKSFLEMRKNIFKKSSNVRRASEDKNKKA